MLLRTFVSLVLVLTVVSGSACAAGVVEPSGSWDFAPLQYSHIVVRGTVTAVSDSTVSGEDFWGEPKGLTPPRQMKVLVVHLLVAETLRGPAAPNTWSYIYWSENPQRAAQLFPLGKEMLISAEMHPRLGAYYYSGNFGQYVRNGQEWQSDPGQRLFDDSYLRTKIREVTLGQIASRAELILVGTIVAVDKSSASGPDGSWAEKVTLSVDVEKVKKGTLTKSTLEVVMLTRGSYEPTWREPVPATYGVGQRWLFLVKHGEVGWYPFAGSNGLLKVENDHLVYGDAVPYWLTPAEADKAIASASKEAEE